MYAINYIQRNVLITASECQYKFGNAISPDKWNAAIEIAESRFVIPLLGYNLYTAICNAKNIEVTSGNIATLQASFDAQYPPSGTITLKIGNIVNAVELPAMSPEYKLLWNSHLWKYVYECVYFVALSSNYAQFSSQGLMKNNPVGSVIGDTKTESVGISLADIKWLEDRSLLDRINPLQTVLEQYLCVNRGSYTLYDSRVCDNCDNKSRRTTSFILDVYDDDYDRKSHDEHLHVTPSPVPAPYRETCRMIVTIAATPNSTLIPLCNLQTIAAQYPEGATLTIPHLIGKNVILTNIGSNPVTLPYDITQGKFTGAFIDGDIITIVYTETMNA